MVREEREVMSPCLSPPPTSVKRLCKATLSLEPHSLSPALSLSPTAHSSTLSPALSLSGIQGCGAAARARVAGEIAPILVTKLLLFALQPPVQERGTQTQPDIGAISHL